MSISAILALENGMIFRGKAFGDTRAIGEGEIVFNTAMSGYQEVLTDPSYCGQILTFTYPHIGNYGWNDHDSESEKFHAESLVVVENCKRHSNWRASRSLEDELVLRSRIGIEGIDTRQLVRVLRSEGAMRSIVSTQHTEEDALDAARLLPSMNGLDLCPRVTTSARYQYEPKNSEGDLLPTFPTNSKYRVHALDFGIKNNILRQLALLQCEVHVFPANTTFEELSEGNPDGYFLSNGPGDPSSVTYAIDTTRKLIQQNKPVFGICLGHQILGLAFGATTYKMKFGHRGANHPVKNLLTEKVEISSQNHGFAVAMDSLPTELEATHINLNDKTLSGFRHREKPIFCVQYHPEASPGPHDSHYLFNHFAQMMEAG